VPDIQKHLDKPIELDVKLPNLSQKTDKKPLSWGSLKYERFVS